MDKKRFKLLAAAGAFLLNIVLLGAVGKLIVPEEWGNDFTLQRIVLIIQEIEITSVIVLLSVKIFKIKIDIGRENIVKGIFWYGLVVCIAVIVDLAMAYTAPEKSITAALPHILLSFVTQICVGVAEEVTCRGFLFGACREYFGESKKGICLSVFISALIFGCWHLGNLISSPDLVIATAAQVIYATEFGIIFAVIYYRSKNLVPCIVLHGLFDFASDFWTCFAGDVNEAVTATRTADIDIVSALVVIALCSPFVISGLWQLRNVFKTKAVEETANG
ncbi:MAG: CPBP family intramembrane metalloprotease [Oribacterium sp.]|nr:CPBP family intramembrane metalloprotease [Oribacterium sp.]MBQ5330705.1 CPBP family intramembrane metalloprotease [Oscillospiraceae bacterium]